MNIFLLVVVLASNPHQIFGVVAQYETLSQCHAAKQVAKTSGQALGCMQVVVDVI